MKTKIISFVSVFLVAFITYAITANPDVTFTDNGELAAVISTFGVAHPTGYPLFTILGHFWSLLPHPFSDIFWLNLFASFTTALSAGVFSLILLELFFLLKPDFNKISGNNSEKYHYILLSANAILFSFIYIQARTIWEQGLSLEVYSLQLLMFNLIIFSLLKVLDSNKPDKWLLLTAFFTGLGFSNHMTTILILPGLIVVYFMIKNENSTLLKSKFKSLLILALPFIAGISLYISLPLISSGEPLFNWGAVHRNLDKFLYHVQGKQYQVWMFSGAEVAKENLIKFFSLVPYQVGWLGIILTSAGLFISFKYNKTLAVFLLVSLLSCLLYSINYSIHDIDAYFSLAFIVLIIYVIYSFIYLYEKKRKIANIIFPVYIILFIPSNFSENDKSDNYLVKEYMTILTEELDSNAIVISAQWDYWCSAFWYYQQVEGYRTDIELVEKELMRRTWYPLQLRNWYPQLCAECEQEISSYEEQLELFESELQYNPMQIQQRFEKMLHCFIDKNLGKKPIYVTMDMVQTEMNIVNQYTLIPEGFAFRVYPKGTEEKPFIDLKKLDKFVETAKEHNENHLEKGIIAAASMSLTNAGRLSMMLGDIDEAIQYLNKAIEIDKENNYAIQALNQIKRK